MWKRNVCRYAPVFILLSASSPYPIHLTLAVNNLDKVGATQRRLTTIGQELVN